jgi:SAM-dependent methyltransferase
VSPQCRSCASALSQTLIDFGSMPLANAFLSAEDLSVGHEARYPLHARVCGNCFLVQVDDVVDPDVLFSDYAYFSSYSQSWLEHAKRFAAWAIDRYGLDASSRVVELASNDGYLLRHFCDAGIPVLGIEPAENVAEVARSSGVPTDARFFGAALARELVDGGVRADLIVANNVLAHVPDLGDFVEGIRILLAADGVATIEFPHLLRMLERVEFDTIYHEHYSYFSLMAAMNVLARHNLAVVDVTELPTHGGSVRIEVTHDREGVQPTATVHEVLAAEREADLDQLSSYDAFAARAGETRDRVCEFLNQAQRTGRRVAGYGAAAKGNTLLNWCEATPEQVIYVADANPYKQGRFLPGSHIPVVSPETLLADRPDDVLILPWNLRDEITRQLDEIHSYGGRFVIPIPELEVIA